MGETFIQAVKDFFNDSGMEWAASIAYYSLLSSFPLILAIITIAAFFMSPEWAIEQITRLMGEYLPTGELEIENLIREAIEERGAAGILSLIGLLWAGTRVFGTVTIALNIAYDVDETYPFAKRLLVELVMLLTVGLLFIIAIAARPVLTLLTDILGVLPISESVMYETAVTVLPVILLFIVFFLVYRYIPRRTVNNWAAVVGAALATALFYLARPLFLAYVAHFAAYNLVYGSLAIIIIIVLWAWITAVILIFGGEVVAHIQDMLIEGKSAEEVEERHRERSPNKQATEKFMPEFLQRNGQPKSKEVV